MRRGYLSTDNYRKYRFGRNLTCNCCVRFVAVVAGGSRNTHYRVARYGLLGPVFHRLDRASHTGAFGYVVPVHQRLIGPIRPSRGHIPTSSRCDLYGMPSLCGSA
jgi:hypothetical protein